MSIVIAPFGEPLPASVGTLAAAAEQENYPHIRRLLDEWASGTNRFDRPGESLLGAHDGDVLAAVGGMTLELSRGDWLRMRRFYVLPDYRGQGIARLLARELLDHARRHTTTVTVHAGDDRAGLFWQAMGFRVLARESYTHILEFG